MAADQIGGWSRSRFRDDEWQEGTLFARLEGDELVLVDASGSYNVETRIPLALIDALRATASPPSR